uniref:Uncharacterized protein n=1 Tax=Tetraselmis sp. GSL018 TaxID=582737 RepID=A0A061SG17_9CHLO|mmetsp:Transcript_26776/g.63509  ORF Transcript_26776/g.63509 Transcript_26776/m.63509 type:complete len:194 (+) Transcript_26776:102-683(+)
MPGISLLQLQLRPTSRSSSEPRKVRSRVVCSMAPMGRRKDSRRAFPRSDNGSVPYERQGKASNRPSRSPTPGPESLSEVFYFGAALVETISERLSNSLVELVSEVSKAAAELPDTLEELQEEVAVRARAQIGREQASSARQSRGLPPASRASGGDPQEVVDELRAELAAAKALVQALKNASSGDGSPQGSPSP